MEMRPEHWLFTIPLRLRSLFRWAQADRELEGELRDHLERKTEEYIAQGMTQEEAHRRARLDLGGMEQTKEECRDARRVNWIQDLIQDLRYGLRMLRKSPGFSTVAVLTLALGIGANTSIFSVVNAVLLRPLPYPQADRLEQVERRYSFGNEGAVSATKFIFWRDHNHVFSDLAAFDVQAGGFNLIGTGQPEHVTGIRVSKDFFRVLGISPAIGRDFTSEEQRPGGPNVVIISNALWKGRFGEDRSIIGKAISLSGQSYTIVGVMPPGFESHPAAELWLPLHPVLDPQQTANLFLVLGRLKPNLTLESARTDMARVGEEFRQQYSDLMDKTESIGIENYQRGLTGDVRTALLVLMGAVGLVLLIACANVANLLLTRAVSRDKEVAIRSALGATRGTLVRQLLTESVLLAIIGSAIGLLFSVLGLPALLRLVPASMPQMTYKPGSLEGISGATLDARVLAFTVAAAFLTGILFGLAPAFQTSRISLNDSLREGGGRTTGRAWHGRLRSLLAVGEVGLSLILLAGATLLIKTFVNLRGTNPGFDPQNVLTMNLSLTDPKYGTTAAVTNFFRAVVDRVDAVPGVEKAALISSLPMEIGPDLPFQIAGRKENSGGDGQYRVVTPGYFSTMKIGVVQGRVFRESDSPNSTRVVIINQALAREFFQGQSPLGEHLTIGVGMGSVFSDEAREVIGVVVDTREGGLSNPAPATVFIPWSQLPDALNHFNNQLLPAGLVVRTHVSPMSLSPAIAEAVLECDSAQPVFQIQPLAAIVGDSVVRQHFNMILLGVFAVLALVLASIGLYGVISYSVAQRTQEIGIRLALGARRGHVLKLILGQGLKLTLIGVVLGTVGALGLTRFMSSLLYGVKSTDPLTLISVAILLAAVALLACYVPARRAMRVDPMVALRYE